MIKQPNHFIKRDLAKIFFLLFVIFCTISVFFLAPSLSTPTLLSLGICTLLSPWVAALERRGHSRMVSITWIFLAQGVLFFLGGAYGIQRSLSEWESFSKQAPQDFFTFISKIRAVENQFKTHYPLFNSIYLTDDLLKSGHDIGQWFVNHGTLLISKVITSIFLVPPLTFVLLNEGRNIRRRFFLLVPNRFFESFFLVTADITQGISDYIRAKLLEAIVVGILVTSGLFIMGVPYCIVLGLGAGVANIIPYLGPFIGALPGILIVVSDEKYAHLGLSVVLVYLLANIIDTLIIFPWMVAKIVKLHPFILIFVVAIGQQHYGLLGMLISVPVATAFKVILHEIYTFIYEPRIFKTPLLNSIEIPLLKIK